MKKISIGFLLFLAGTFNLKTFAQNLTPTQIVEKAYDNQVGSQSEMNMSLKIIRSSWTREMNFTWWSKGRSMGIMKLTSPAKDKGIGFLKIKSEAWNWIPSIERVVKISPAQLGQSWMGSDFTNEDVLKEASIIYDYTHKIISEENFGGVLCYRIEAIPKPNAAVVWGKVVLLIGKADGIQRNALYYDEEKNLVNTLTYSEIKSMGGKLIATKWEIVPAKKQGNKSVVTIGAANFSVKLADDFFSQQNLKRAN